VVVGMTIWGSSGAEGGVGLRRVEVSIEMTPVNSMRPQFDENSVPALIASCSTMGPSASAGKKVSPPMMTMTPTTRPMNRPPVVGNVPIDGGIDFLAASEPAIAIAGMIIQKRPTSIAAAPVKL